MLRENLFYRYIFGERYFLFVKLKNLFFEKLKVYFKKFFKNATHSKLEMYVSL